MEEKKYYLPIEKIDYLKAHIATLKEQNRSDRESNEFCSYNWRNEGRYKAYEEVLQWVIEGSPNPGLPPLAEPILTDKDMKDWEKGKLTTREYTLLFIPCAEDDQRACGSYTPNDGQSFCYVREGYVPKDQSQQGAVLVREANNRDLDGMHNRTYGENEYPDLSSATPEQKAETINGLVLVTAREVLKMFLAFGLKTHIECTVINDPTKEEFDFIFRKKGKAAETVEDAVAFLNWTLSSECDTYTCTDEDQWTNIYTKESITTAELYKLFKQNQKS